MNASNEQVDAILRRAEDTLQTARHGFDDLQGTNRARRLTGLRNLIVFGRSVTWVLQNLRSVLGEAFDSWYSQKQTQMQSDPLMRYFVQARNDLEKQGKLAVNTQASIRNFSSGDVSKFGPPPPGATSFFIADQLGGSGWEVELPDGSMQKYYVELPSEIGAVTQHFGNLPDSVPPELRGQTIETLCESYLAKLDSLLDEARAQFLGAEPRQVSGGKLLPSYLRVVK